MRGRRAWYAAAIVAVSVATAGTSLAIVLPGSSAGPGVAGPGDMPPVSAKTSVLEARFAVLSRRHTNQCGLRAESLQSIAVDGRLQGSCCSPMTFGRYARQVRGLVRYRSVKQIPADPYDIPVSQAGQLLAYDREIQLTAQQQATYRHAMKLSDEHGPCCCHCWRWSAFEGQAKFLITRRGYAASQIAQVWNLEDGCGGAD